MNKTVEELRIWRIQNGITQRSVCDYLGVKIPTFSAWERNACAMPEDIRRRYEAFVQDVVNKKIDVKPSHLAGWSRKSKLSAEEKEALLKRGIDTAERYLSAMKEALGGKSFSSVSRKYQIPFSSFDFFLTRNFETGKREYMKAKDVFISWEEKLFIDIADCNLEEVPTTALESIQYAIEHTLSDRERAVILMRYEDCQTLEEAANQLNVTRERVRQIEAKALRKLRLRKNFIKAEKPLVSARIDGKENEA